MRRLKTLGTRSTLKGSCQTAKPPGCFIGGRLIREQAPAWPHVIGNAVALVLATLNMLVHTHDAWTSVVPWGLTLSALVVLILLFTSWVGWPMVSRHRVGGIAHG
jgi:uncharacterized membrane protein